METLIDVTILLIVAAALNPVKGFGGEHDAEKVLSAKANITVTAPKEWIAGTRLWLAVTVKNMRANQIDGPPLEANPFDYYGYSYQLRRRSDGKVVVSERYNATPFTSDLSVGPDGPGAERLRPHFTIGGKESLRLLFPIPWPAKVSPTPDDYDLELTINAVLGEVGRAASTLVAVRNPTEEEARILKVFSAANGFDTRRRSDALERLVVPQSLARETGLGFELLLYRLRTAQKPLREMNETMLDAHVPATFTPEIAVLKYELLRAKGQDSDAKKLREDILAKYPGIAFRLENVDKGSGIIATIRGSK